MIITIRLIIIYIVKIQFVLIIVKLSIRYNWENAEKNQNNKLFHNN